jgi:chromosome segregation ATPase
MTIDPTGTIGGQPPSASSRDGALDDLALAYKGGAGFTERLTQLGAARDAHDRAFAQLNLGNDVLAQRAAAQAELDAAVQAKAQAVATLEEANKVRAAADAYAADARAKADKLHEAAAAAKADVDRALAAAMADREQHRRAVKAADAAKASAEERQAAMEAKLARLQAGLRSLA